ncbi:hypothetical protein BDW67DRAFT_181372 [Aspergillus spinulosporus]
MRSIEEGSSPLYSPARYRPPQRSVNFKSEPLCRPSTDLSNQNTKVTGLETNASTPVAQTDRYGSEGVRSVSEIAAGSELQSIEDLSESILQGITDVKDMLEQILPSAEPDERRSERRARDSESATAPGTWVFRIESSIVAIVLIGAVLGVIVNLFYIGLIIGWLWAHYDWAGWDA